MYNINKIESKICEIERNAMTGKELPAGYTQPEQLLFLSLRVLHWEYRHREITLEQARKEKERLAREYIQAARFQVIYQQAVEIRNHMGQYLTMANKGKCPVCKKLVEIFEGREDRAQAFQNKVADNEEVLPGMGGGKVKIKPRNVIYQRVQDMIWDSNKSFVKIAREIGVSPAAVSSWQTMERTISVEALARLCEYTHTNPAWVLGLSERREL